MTTNDTSFTNLDDGPLLDAARRLATEERRATAALLRALMEIDSRRLYLGESCASMFTYCTQVLHMAEGAAYNRIEAARASRRHPMILDLFEQSAITLTAVRLLAPHLTPENHAAVLAAARHKSKHEVEELVVALRPKPDAPVVVRKLPTTRSTPTVPPSSPSGTPVAPPVPSVSPRAESRSESRTQSPIEPAPVAPLAADRYRIQLTVTRATHDKFRHAQALLRHAVPSGDAAETFDRALTLLVEDLERKRFAATSRPRTATSAAKRSRHVPAVVRRHVWQRDGGRCAFVGAEGRCRETAFLEFHHVDPFAAGGETTVKNVELRCRAHNLHEARLFFGDGIVRERWPQWGVDVLHTCSKGQACSSSEPRYVVTVSPIDVGVGSGRFCVRSSQGILRASGGWNPGRTARPAPRDRACSPLTGTGLQICTCGCDRYQLSRPVDSPSERGGASICRCGVEAGERSLASGRHGQPCGNRNSARSGSSRDVAMMREACS